MGVRPAAGGGRWVEVSPERLPKWLAGFDERHAVSRTRYTADLVTVFGGDGTVAECHCAFPLAGGGDHPGLVADALVAHAQAVRTVGVLLARLGGHAAGVFEGTTLVASKVGARLVQGRTAAGGWSQQRFARRRAGQAVKAAGAAADDIARVLVPRLSTMEGVVLGGERRAVDALRDDPRLTPVFALAVDRFLTTPDPKLAVLQGTPTLFRSVHIRLVDP
jgi:hypothetical protein